MGFDASEVGRDPDAERLLRSSYSPSMNYEVRRLQEMLRSSGIDRRLASFQGSIAHGVAQSVARSVTPNVAQSVARSVAPSLARSVTPSMARSIESLRSAAMSSLSSSIAQAFEVHGFDSASIAAWSLRSVQSIRTSALPPILRAATTFGPIVVSPDYEDDAPFDYHPDLGRLLPETATNSGGATEVQELWVEVVAFAQGIANHHRTKVFLSVMTNGTRFVIRVSKHPAAAGAIGGGISAQIGFEIGGAAGATIAGVTGPLITYLLTRR
jgi:hypothetical protein